MNEKPNPYLIIENGGGVNLGTCYNAGFYVIKSLNKPLADSDIKALRDMGFVGYGQEYKVRRMENELVGYDTYFVVKIEDYVDSSG